MARLSFMYYQLIKADLICGPYIVSSSFRQPHHQTHFQRLSTAKMQHWNYLISILSISLLFDCLSAHNILLTNDDGWAVAQIRAQRDSLVNGGFDVRILFPRYPLNRR